MEPNRPRGNNQPVMDVQKPSVKPNDPPQVIQPNSSSLGRPATMEYTRPRQESSNSESQGFSSPTTHIPPVESAKIPEKPKPKKTKRVIATLLIIIGLLGVAAAGAYFYIAYQNEEPAPAPVVQTEEVVPEEDIQATPEGVDQTVQDIDQALNSIDDTADFSPSDLSDDSLGL